MYFKSCTIPNGQNSVHLYNDSIFIAITLNKIKGKK